VHLLQLSGCSDLVTQTPVTASATWVVASWGQGVLHTDQWVVSVPRSLAWLCRPRDTCA
jgi:hypothetical protein